MERESLARSPALRSLTGAATLLASLCPGGQALAAAPTEPATGTTVSVAGTTVSVVGSVQAVEVELVAEGVISTDGNETFPTEDPVDGALWFSTYEGGFDDQTIVVARRDGDSWAPPEVAPFSGQWGDRAPRFSSDGSRLYFTSNRPTAAGGEEGDMNIWVVSRRQGGGWGEPELVPAPVSVAEGRDIHNVVTADGTIYVASNRPGGRGRSDIYRIPRTNGEYGEVQPLPAPINDELSQPDLYVSPDASWMILVITEHPSGLGGDDLYISRLENGVWSEPANLGAPINSPEYEYGPTVSRDGDYLYFTSHRRGSADVYRVPISALE